MPFEDAELKSNEAWRDIDYFDETTWRNIQNSLICFAAFDREYNPQFLGTGFLIGRLSDGMVLALTAKHVIKQGAIAAQKAIKHRAPTFPSILSNDLPLIGKTDLKALWIGPGNSDMMEIRYLEYHENTDTAFCILQPNAHVLDYVTKHATLICLDTRLPTPGSIVSMVSYTDFHFSVLSRGAGYSATWRVGCRPIGRVGRVVSTSDVGMGHSGPCFRASFPVSGGMSGGFSFCSKGPFIGANGIISAGSQSDSELSDYLVSGDTNIVGILTALGCKIPHMGANGYYLIEALKDGALRDMADGVTSLKFEVRPDLNGVEIYRD